jgi:hypothetical protein
MCEMLLMNRLSSDAIYFAPLIVLATSMTGCYLFDAANVPPYGKLPAIQESYSVCPHCGSLDGGIYGKGPTKQLRTENGKDCVHHWQPITKKEFLDLGVTSFKIEWSKEIPFWSRESLTPLHPEIPPSTTPALP